MKRVLYIFVLFLGALTLSIAAQKDIDKVIQEIDELYRSDSSYAEVEMAITTPHWERTLKMKTWSKGMKKTFIRILEPRKERGVATLRIGNEMWNYLPKTNKVMKIPPSMMMSSWMGSDFTNDDLVKEYTFFEDYIFKFTEVKDPEGGVLYIKCIPKEGRAIVWGYVVIAVKESNNIPIWQKYYDEKGEVMRVMYFKDVKVFDDRKIPSVMELIPKTKKGHKTVLRYLDAEFNINIDEDIFTLRNLRKRI